MRYRLQAVEKENGNVGGNVIEVYETFVLVRTPVSPSVDEMNTIAAAVGTDVAWVPMGLELEVIKVIDTDRGSAKTTLQKVREAWNRYKNQKELARGYVAPDNLLRALGKILDD